MNETTYIYALSSPEDPLNIRYIGKADKPIKRLISHLREASQFPHYRKSRWIQSLTSNVIFPVVSILDEVPAKHWQEYEIKHIKMARDAGFDLTNTTPGGEGVGSGPENPNFGLVRSQETRSKIGQSKIGKMRPKFSDEHIAKLTKSSLGRKHPGCSSKFLGVSISSVGKRYLASITIDQHQFNLGRYDQEIAAAQAYDWVASLYGRPLNFSEGGK